MKQILLAVIGGKTVTFDSNKTVTSAMIVSTLENSHANGTFCQITSLEVYRGENQTTMVDHRGFSLDEDATINVSMYQKNPD